MSRYKLIPLNGKFILADFEAECQKGSWTIFPDSSNGVITGYNEPVIAENDYAANGIYNLRVVASTHIPDLPLISRIEILSLYEALPNKEAKFTEGDLRKAYRQGSFDSNAMARTLHKKEKAYNSVDEYLQSLLPATVTERFCEIEWINDGYRIKILKLI